MKKVIEKKEAPEKIETPETIENISNSDNEILTNKLLEVVNATDNNLENNSEVTEEKRKRGRPKKETVKEIETPKINIPIYPIIDILISRLPNPIPLTDLEKSYLDEAGNKLADKYSNNIKYLEEIQFSVLLFGVIYPRLKKDKKD